MNLDINILFNVVLGALSFLGGWLFTREFSLFDKQETLMKDLREMGQIVNDNESKK